MLAGELEAAAFEGEFALDNVPAEVLVLAEKFYLGQHPALRALGISFASREDVVKRDAVRRVVALAHLTESTESANTALEALFG